MCGEYTEDMIEDLLAAYKKAVTLATELGDRNNQLLEDLKGAATILRQAISTSTRATAAFSGYRDRVLGKKPTPPEDMDQEEKAAWKEAYELARKDTSLDW